MHFGIDDIRILHTGPGWLVSEKPAGMSIHNDPEGDLLAILHEKIVGSASLRAAAGWQTESVLAAVHRLDRDTSGVVLVACREDVRRYFSEQFSARKVRKKYIALLHGRLPAPHGSRLKGEWRLPLTQTAAGRSHPQGGGKKKPSVTRYEIVSCSDHYTWVSCEPVTGRTHQIRRHAKLAGHPVVGDRRYGSRRALKFLLAHCNFNRLALHSEAMSFQPPESDAFVTVRSSGIPDEIRRLFDADQSGVTTT